MRDLLMILNPRNIAECVNSYRDLPIDRLWISRMTEPQIEERWDEIMSLTEGYDRLLMVSDDAIVRRPALDAVIQLMTELHPVVNGYCNLDVTDWRVTVNRAPLGFQSVPEDFDWMTLGDVMSFWSSVVPTTTCAFSLTGMSREMWLRYPFSNKWGASDFSLARRLTWDSVPMVVAREGFVYHVKETWNKPDQEPRKRLLVGAEPPKLVLETGGITITEEAIVA